MALWGWCRQWWSLSPLAFPDAGMGLRSVWSGGRGRLFVLWWLAQVVVGSVCLVPGAIFSGVLRVIGGGGVGGVGMGGGLEVAKWIR